MEQGRWTDYHRRYQTVSMSSRVLARQFVRFRARPSARVRWESLVRPSSTNARSRIEQDPVTSSLEQDSTTEYVGTGGVTAVSSGSFRGHEQREKGSYIVESRKQDNVAIVKQVCMSSHYSGNGGGNEKTKDVQLLERRSGSVQE